MPKKSIITLLAIGLGMCLAAGDAVAIDPIESSLTPPPWPGSAQPLTSIYSEWDNDDWAPIFKYEFEYAAPDQPSQQTMLLWQADDWANGERSVFTYPADGVTEELKQTWEVDKWLDYWRSVYYEGGLGSGEELIEQVWADTGWLYESKTRLKRASGLITRETVYEWTLGEWVESHRTDYAYDAGDSLIEQIDLVHDGLNWENQTRQTFTYDGSGLLMVYLIQTWDGDEWLDEVRYRYTYRGDDQLSTVVQESPDGSHWEPVMQTTYSYDAFDQQAGFVVQDLNSGHEVNSYQQSYTYDGQGRIVFETMETWNENHQTWHPKSQWEYGYDTPTSVDDNRSAQSLPDQPKLRQNSPNPFNPVTEISFEMPRRGEAVLTIYNGIGQRVGTLLDGVVAAGEHRFVWDGRDYASGVYFYRLQTAQGTRARKMILLK